MNQIKEEWDLSKLFNGKEESEIKIKILSLKQEIVNKKELLLREDVPATTVLDFIKLNEALELEFSRIIAHYSLRAHVDLNDEEANAKLDYYSQLGTDINNETLFFDLWFIGLSKEKAEEYINNSVLFEYKQLLKDLIKLKPYTKSEEIEQILNIKNITGKSAFSKIYEMFTSNFSYDFLDQKNLTQEEVISKVTDSSPEVRESAYSCVLTKYKENSATLSEIYKNIVLSWNNENIKIRNYSNAAEPRHVSNNLDGEVVDTMIRVIRSNSGLFQEYFKLKKEFLEKKGKPHSYSRFHIYAPFDASSKEYSYEECKKIVLETFKEFDNDFYVFANQVFEEKHIHSHPQKGKRGGAFCYSPNKEVTPFVFLNHTNKLRDLFTMMHELGHAVHDLFSFRNPNSLCHPVIPLAETASILSELILSNKLLKKSSGDEKAALLLYLLDHYYATIIRQTYFVVFEDFAHKKFLEGAQKKELDDYYFGLLKEQFGDMNVPDLFKHEWNYLPHIHNAPFYCYAYSWGNLLVLALYAKYEEDHSFKEKIKDILRAGASKETLEILKEAGVDPSKEEFWEAGFNIIKKELAEFKSLFNT